MMPELTPQESSQFSFTEKLQAFESASQTIEVILESKDFNLVQGLTLPIQTKGQKDYATALEDISPLFGIVKQNLIIACGKQFNDKASLLNNFTMASKVFEKVTHLFEEKNLNPCSRNE